MRTIKLYDAWIQAILITAFIILSLINSNSGFLMGYFVIGTYQLINTIVHALISFKSASKYRYYYNLTLIYIAVIFGVAFLIPSVLFIIAYLMLFVTPVLAIAYTTICFYEVKKLQERPLAQLK